MRVTTAEDLGNLVRGARVEAGMTQLLQLVASLDLALDLVPREETKATWGDLLTSARDDPGDPRRAERTPSRPARTSCPA